MDFQNFLLVITNSTGDCICIFIFGISAGIDMALHIVSYFFGAKIGRATARQMEYPYPQNSQRNRNT
jgi:hypothetical protein